MKLDEYKKYDGLGLAALVARRETTASELLEAAIERAAAVNPRLNAIVVAMHDAARARATEPLKGPFAGVPFLTKDLFQEYAGVPSAMGCKGLKAAGRPAAEHSEITRRWLDAGAVVFGRTSTPELGAKGVTEPEAWGPARNPWDPGRTPGGSSGGSAAAVAARIVPVAGANDGGGSIRIPAACCGLFGLKPGRGRTPWGPKTGEQIHGAAVNHVLSRSVRDSAAMLDATHGPEGPSLFRIEPPERPYLEEAGRDPAPLKIAFTARSPLGDGVHPEAAQAVGDAARLLESLGHRVEETEPAIDGARLAQDFLIVWFVTCATSVDAIARETGCGKAGFELDTLAMAAVGAAIGAKAYAEACQRWNEHARQLAALHARYDLFMTPALAQPPVPIGAHATPAWQRLALRVILPLGLSRLLLASGVVEKMAHVNLGWVPFSQLANVTGTPAMSLPLHWTAGGLPLGVQFVAPPGGEGLLFRLAGQLERAKPWADREASAIDAPGG